MPALILMYHDVSDNQYSIPPGHRPYVLDTSTFQVQMHAVSTSGLPNLTVGEWGLPVCPPQATILTFDDGHVSNHDVALPILLEHQLKATFFITAGFIGNGETMNWKQILNLHNAGMEIGSHTLTHRPPSTLNDDELHHELTQSRSILEDGLGAPVTSISSPTGFFNPRMCIIAREVGYKSLCFGRIGLAENHGDPFTLNRISVKKGMNLNQFTSLLQLDRGLIRTLRFRQMFLDWLRKTLKPETYLRLRKVFINRR